MRPNDIVLSVKAKHPLRSPEIATPQCCYSDCNRPLRREALGSASVLTLSDNVTMNENLWRKLSRVILVLTSARALG